MSILRLCCCCLNRTSMFAGLLYWKSSKCYIFTQTRDFYTNSLRLDVNCSAIGSWCEIDAIKLTGRLSRTVGEAHTVFYLLLLLLKLYCANNLYCHFIFVMSLQEDHWGQPLANDLNELVNSSQFSDVAFNVGGERIVAHKAILVSRSQYFRAMFTNSLRETYSGRDETIVIEGVSAVGFLAMIRYLYTGTIDTSVTPLTLVELIRGLFVKLGLILNFCSVI